LKRAVQREQQRDAQGKQTQARGGGHQRDQPRRPAHGDQISEPQRQQRRPGEVEGRPQVLRLWPNLCVQRSQQQPVAENQSGNPRDEQNDDDE
jgi:hypothetical protein